MGQGISSVISNAYGTQHNKILFIFVGIFSTLTVIELLCFFHLQSIYSKEICLCRNLIKFPVSYATLALVLIEIDIKYASDRYKNEID